MKVYLIILLAMIMVMGFASASITEITDTGSDTVYSQVCKVNTDCGIRAICENNFAVAGTGAQNQITIIDPDNIVLIEHVNMSRVNSYYVYNFTPSKLGSYNILFYCKEAGDDGAASMVLNVTTSGQENSMTYIIITSIFLFLIAGAFLFASTFFDTKKWVVKSAMVLCSMLILIMAVNSALDFVIDVKSQQMLFYTFVILITATSFMFAYLIIGYFVAIIKAFRDAKKEQRANDLL